MQHYVGFYGSCTCVTNKIFFCHQSDTPKLCQGCSIYLIAPQLADNNMSNDKTQRAEVCIAQQKAPNGLAVKAPTNQGNENLTA